MGVRSTWGEWEKGEGGREGEGGGWEREWEAGRWPLMRNGVATMLKCVRSKFGIGFWSDENDISMTSGGMWV